MRLNDHINLYGFGRDHVPDQKRSHQRDLEIRLALGAQRKHVSSSLLGQILPFAGVGVVLGLLLSFLTKKLIADLVFEISALDPTTYIALPIALMTLVVEGTDRGRTVKVCAVTVRHRASAEVLRRIGAPLDRADLALIASTLLRKLDPLRKELLARRHKLVEGTASEVTHPQVQQALARMLRQPDEGALSKLLIEVVLLECTDRVPTTDPDVLTATAKRHRVDVGKLRIAVEQEFTAKRAKLTAKQKKAAKKATPKTAA